MSKDTRRKDKFDRTVNHFKNTYKNVTNDQPVFKGYTDFLNSKEKIGDIDIKDHMKRIKSHNHYLRYPNKFRSEPMMELNDIDSNGEEFQTKFIAEKEKTIKVAHKYKLTFPNKNVCILNFASAKNAGGGFLKGSMAQEESIAYVSTLYHAIVGNTMYEDNRKKPNNGLYNHICIYTNEICVFKLDRDTEFIDPFYPSIISCPAVNKTHALSCGVDEGTIYDTMVDRIRLLLETAKQHNVEILILGAFGCGVFGNDPKDVKEIFMGLLKNDYENVFEQVVFAVPDDKYEIFKNM